MRAIAAAIMLLACGALLLVTWNAAWNRLSGMPGRTEIEHASASATRVDSAGNTTVAARATSPTPLNADSGVAAPIGGTPAAGVEDTGNRVRFVEQDGIVSVRVEGPLERSPDAPVTQAAPPPPKDEPELYRLVVIESAGEIDLRTHRIRLAEVDPPGVDTMCTNASGGLWPCGRRARTALRRLIRRRAIGCFAVKLDANGQMVRDKDAPPPQKGETRPAQCSVANTDLAEWLLENGWATPSATAPGFWRALHDQAKAAGLGIYDPNGR